MFRPEELQERKSVTVQQRPKGQVYWEPCPNIHVLNDKMINIDK